jgi:hypothetical protein
MPEDMGAPTHLIRRRTDGDSCFREATAIEAGPAELSVEQVLFWADAHNAVHGCWPEIGSGDVTGVSGETWRAINHALALGLRGLPGDSSLAELLAEHRGAPAPDMGPMALAEKIWAWEQAHFPINRPRRGRRAGRPFSRLAIKEILAWADAHHRATGVWPRRTSGSVLGAPDGETWEAVDQASVAGDRGLPGGWSLADLLAEHRGVCKFWERSRQPIDEVFAWAVKHHPTTDYWPATIG